MLSMHILTSLCELEVLVLSALMFRTNNKGKTQQIVSSSSRRGES